jgi:hypothetical protein
MGKYKTKTEVIKIQGRSNENDNRRLEAAEGKRSNAEDSGVPESTLRKAEDRDGTNFSRSLQGYVFKPGR